MSYQVLARKYRPQKFGDVLGQTPVIQTLQNALKSDRLHHAYLFCGARGVGKTTVARILAKALNCEKGVSNEPCNQCACCEEVTSGRSLDVQEIDGASNTGVDDVRQVREQTKFMPAQGRYKVYIIDEVHMLSTSAFNALLKTLEEPPAHVVFIFATTEPHKIPATILSRCQRYDFKRIPAKQLASSLREIAQNEKVEISSEALNLIAYEAQGSLRDGQSLLDQAIAYSGPDVSYEKLQEMLGFLDRKLFWQLLEGVLLKNRRTSLDLLNQFYEIGSDLNRLAQDFVAGFRHLILLNSLPEKPDWFDLPGEEVQKLTEFSKILTLQELDQLFNIAYRGLEDLAHSPQPKMLFEILLIRMTQVEKVVPIFDLLEKIERVGLGTHAVQHGALRLTPTTSGPTASLSTTAVASVQTSEPKQEASHLPAVPVSATGSGKTWPQFLTMLNQKKPQLASILGHGKMIGLNEQSLRLCFERGSVYGEMLKEEDRQVHLAKWLTDFFGKNLTIEILFEGEALALESTNGDRSQRVRAEALQSRSVQEAANILGAVVEEVLIK